MKIRVLFLAAMLCALCAGQASALEYTMEAPDDYLFARPTSDETIYEWENPNVDRSKNTALIPPVFGSPTSYLPGSGTPLTPNLVPGALDRGLVTQTGPVNYPIMSNGLCLTASILESPNPGNGCSLSVILIPDAPEKYFLSPAAMEKLLYSSSAAPKDTGSMTRQE